MLCTALAPTSKVHNVQLACTLYCSELAACVGGALAVAQRALNKESGQPRAPPAGARRRGMGHGTMLLHVETWLSIGAFTILNSARTTPAPAPSQTAPRWSSSTLCPRCLAAPRTS